MTIAERVHAFLTEHRPAAFCDDCIAAEVPLKRRQQANLVTGALATTAEFRREQDTCSTCGELKMVIRRMAAT